MKIVKTALVARDLGEGRREGRRGRAQGILGNATIILYDTIMVDVFHYAFVKTHGMYNTKCESSCKLWAFVNNNVSTLAHQLLTNVLRQHKM